MQINPLSPMKNALPYSDLIALDIETGSNGQLLDIGIYDGNKFSTFRTWQTFFNNLFKRQGKFRVFAHNGFGFDFIGMFQWFLQNHRFYGLTENDITFLSSASLIIAVVIRHENSAYTFMDTSRFFPGTSLEKLANDFLNESKNDVSKSYINRMEVYKAKYPKRYYAYLEKDCTLLYRIYSTFRDEINGLIGIGELGLSSGSTALKCFRRKRYATNPRGLIFACPSELQHVSDAALRGGLTSYIGDGAQDNHLYEQVNSYDIVSMYPSIMLTIPVPTSPLRRSNKIEKTANRVKPGWYLCDYEQKKGRVPFIYSIDASEPSFTGTGMLTHLDVEFLQQMGMVKCHESLIYDSFEYAFRDMILEMLNERLRAKSNGEIARATALKIILNSLYGKFAQGSMREIIAMTANLDLYESKIKASIYSGGAPITEYMITDSLVLYGYPSDSSTFSNRFIGAMITAFARLKLGIMLNTYPTIYCDTDSLFTQEKIDDFFISNDAGYFEMDKRSPQSMICLGKKSYTYAETIKFKGIPQKTFRANKEIPTLNQADIQNLRFNYPVTTHYRRPTAFKTAMKTGVKNPNKFEDKTRTVKRGLSLNEKGILRRNEEYFSLEFAKNWFERLTFKRRI